MPFYQNPFDAEFRGHWLCGGERQLSLTFPVPAHKGRGDYWEAANFGPYDLDGYNTLTINYAFDVGFKNYSKLQLNISPSPPTPLSAHEVAGFFNADPTFAELFKAEVRVVGQQTRLLIKSRKTKTSLRMYISNSGAEKVFRFNKAAGVAELPSYFDRHTVDKRFDFEDGLGMLVRLDESDAIDRVVITEAGFDYNAMKADWQHLKGRSGSYTFKKQTVDSSSRVTLVIEYPAGAKVGDLARKIAYTYTGSKTAPDTVAETPYVLQSADLITP